jgi:hypothetical protein
VALGESGIDRRREWLRRGSQRPRAGAPAPHLIEKDPQRPYLCLHKNVSCILFGDGSDVCESELERRLIDSVVDRKSKAADRACPERSRRECPLHTFNCKRKRPI